MFSLSLSVKLLKASPCPGKGLSRGDGTVPYGLGTLGSSRGINGAVRLLLISSAKLYVICDFSISRTRDKRLLKFFPLELSCLVWIWIALIPWHPHVS